MNKDTNRDLPDPNDWARRLHDQLEQIGAYYFATDWKVANDPEEFTGLNLKQTRAAEALLAIYSALRELPLLKTSKGAAVLHDVACALNDVVLGGSPRLFSPVPTGGPGGDGTHRNYIKINVVLAVRFLIEAHQLTAPQSISTVTQIFAAAGATGRKGNPLSTSTVKDWCDKAHHLASNQDDLFIHRRAELRLDKLRNDPAWPGNYEDSIAWVEGLSTHPLLSSKYG